MKLVSIIMTTYNSSPFLKESIMSIVSQTYKNWELLITDDFSSDNSVNIIIDIMKLDKRIFLFNLLVNSGAGVARNNSIKYSKGDYIAFCDSDDQWKPEKLFKQISFMDKHNAHLSHVYRQQKVN